MRGILHTEKMFPDMDPAYRVRQRMRLIVEYHKRIVLAVACSAFVLLGIPLGIKAHRKESSIGIAMSLVLITAFYMFVIVAEALDRRPELHSYVLLWVPAAVSVGLGTYLIRRGN
jgi:lipopolysaccharide export system permease protein